MAKVSEEKKIEYWEHFVADKKNYPYGPTGTKLGKRAIAKAKKVLWDNNLFWCDIVLRHGGMDRSPDQMMKEDPSTYNHCLGNFWGQVVENI